MQGNCLSADQQTDGTVEPAITGMQSIYVGVQHKTWDQILPYVTFAYNTAIQETVRFMPFHLVYGRQVQIMLDAIISYNIDA